MGPLKILSIHSHPCAQATSHHTLDMFMLMRYTNLCFIIIITIQSHHLTNTNYTVHTDFPDPDGKNRGKKLTFSEGDTISLADASTM